MTHNVKHIITTKTRFLLGGAIFALSFAAVAVTFAAWAPPSANPPGNNAPEPINVSGTSQGKAGRLGIGTSNPTAGLHITNTADDARPDVAGVQISGGGTDWAKLELQGGADNVGGHIDFLEGPPAGSDRHARIILRPGYFGFGVGGAEGNIAINRSSGNVGIGLVNPANRLDVNGDMYLRGGDFYVNENLQLRLDRDGGQNRYFAVRDNGGSWRFLAYENGSVYARGRMYSPIFYDYNNTSYYANPSSVSRFVELEIAPGGLCVDGDGNCSAPNGGVRIGRYGIDATDSAGGWIRVRDKMIHYRQLRLHGSRTRITGFDPAGYHWFRSGCDSDSCVAFGVHDREKAIYSNAFMYGSDVSLKTDIQPIDGALSKILQLEGVSYNWKENGNPGIGLVAQDVEKVFPEIVSGQEGQKSVSYGHLTAPIIKAIQEQQEQIESQNEKIKKQQEQIDRLEAELEEVKALLVE